MASKIETRHFIYNEYIESPKKDVYPVFNPFDETLVGEIPLAREAEVDAAVIAARKAYEGEWSTFTAAQRQKCMLKFADLLEENADEVASLSSKAMGQPLGAAKGLILSACATTFRYYAGFTDKTPGQTYPPDDGYYRIVQYEPLGVCAGIAAWNATLLYVGWKIAPAVAAGNTFIFKSSEKDPFVALRLGALFKEAGFPAGVVNFISGDGATGALLSSHMDIDKISFTGSTATGRRVQEAAAKSNLKVVALEMGGKSPCLVFEDADLENAVLQASSAGFLFNSAQVCTAASRVFVQASVADEFIATLKAHFEGAAGVLGQDPGQPTTMLGPLADKAQFDRVMAYIESGKSEAKLVTGGARVGGKGFWIQPTIFAEAGADAKIQKEEIFGPVLTITTFETEEEGITMANDTPFGLSACIYTKDISRGLRVSSKIKAGTVAINSAFLPDEKMPFGGYKQSGLGRESGFKGIEAYLQAKTIKVKL